MGQGKLLTMQSTWRRECRSRSRLLRQNETESKDATEVEEDATESAELFSVSTLVWALRRRCAATALSLRCHGAALLSAYQKGNYEPHCKGNKSKAQTETDRAERALEVISNYVHEKCGIETATTTRRRGRIEEQTSRS